MHRVSVCAGSRGHERRGERRRPKRLGRAQANLGGAPRRPMCEHLARRHDGDMRARRARAARRRWSLVAGRAQPPCARRRVHPAHGCWAAENRACAVASSTACTHTRSAPPTLGPFARHRAAATTTPAGQARRSRCTRHHASLRRSALKHEQASDSRRTSGRELYDWENDDGPSARVAPVAFEADAGDLRPCAASNRRRSGQRRPAVRRARGRRSIAPARGNQDG